MLKRSATCHSRVPSETNCKGQCNRSHLPQVDFCCRTARESLQTGATSHVRCAAIRLLPRAARPCGTQRRANPQDVRVRCYGVAVTTGFFDEVPNRCNFAALRGGVARAVNCPLTKYQRSQLACVRQQPTWIQRFQARWLDRMSTPTGSRTPTIRPGGRNSGRRISSLFAAASP